MPTIESFEAACVAAIKSTGSRVISVGQLMQVPEYDKLFEGFNDGNITGTQDLHELRMSGIANCPRTGLAYNIQGHYKVDVRVPGYLPRAAYQGEEYFAHWDAYFKHPNESAGDPVDVYAIPCEKVPGKRLSWDYQVTYAQGDQRMYNIACPSLPLLMNADIINSRIASLKEQPCRQDFLEKMAATRANVLELLHGRGYDDSIVSDWEKLFDQMPQSAEETCKVIGDTGVLGTLRDMCGGKMRIKDLSQDKPRRLPCEYMDRISYNGHALAKHMTKQLEDRMRTLDAQCPGNLFWF